MSPPHLLGASSLVAILSLVAAGAVGCGGSASDPGTSGSSAWTWPWYKSSGSDDGKKPYKGSGSGDDTASSGDDAGAEEDDDASAPLPRPCVTDDDCPTGWTCQPDPSGDTFCQR